MTTTMDSSSSPTLYAQVDHRSTNHLPPLFKLGMQTTTFPTADAQQHPMQMQRKRSFLEHRRSSMDSSFLGASSSSSIAGPSQGWSTATTTSQHQGQGSQQQQQHWATVSRGSSAGSGMDLDSFNASASSMDGHSMDHSVDHAMDSTTDDIDPSLSKATSYQHQQAVMASYYRQQQSAIMSNDRAVLSAHGDDAPNNGRSAAPQPQTTKRRRRASLLDEISPVARGGIVGGNVTSNSSGGYGRHDGSSGSRDHAGRQHQRSSFPRAA